MVRHWNVIGALIEADKPRTIVEVGVARGRTTARLLDYAERTDAVVHGIDPYPAADVDELVERYGERFNLHRAPSHDVLPTLEAVDCALIDGDHNWYMVINELRMLDRRAAEAPFPLTFVHDVTWPYGRRDGYFDREAVPEEFRDTQRQSWDPVAGEPEVTPRSGVLTAVEDFIDENGGDITLKVVEGFFGLGVLVSRERLERNPALSEQLTVLDSPAFLAEQCRRLELARIRRVRAAVRARHAAAADASGSSAHRD